MLTGHKQELLYERDPNIQLIWNLFIYRWPVNHVYFVFLPPKSNRGFWGSF